MAGVYRGRARFCHNRAMTERSNFDTGPPDEGSRDLLATIRHWGSELGFQALGFTGVDLGQHRDHLAKWLNAGYHGEMTWMAGHGDKRSRPESLVPGTCTVISARMDYLPSGEAPEAVLADAEKAYVSRYALGRDYHKVMRGRLAKLARRINNELAKGATAHLLTARLSWSGRWQRTRG